MVSSQVRNLASSKMYKERKRILLDTVDETIEKLESNQYSLGLVHNQNVLIPKDAVASFKNDNIYVSRNHLIVKRTVKKLSKDLNYKIILTFDDKLFDDNKIEHIRSKSLRWYIDNRIVPIIVTDLKKQKRSTEVLLRIRDPNEEELKERNKRRDIIEERKQIRNEIDELVGRNKKVIKKRQQQVTPEQKKQKWMDLKEDNRKNYLSRLGFYRIDITYTQGKQKQPLRTHKRKDISSFGGFKQKGSVFDSLILQRCQQYRIIAMNRRLDKDYDADDENSNASWIFSYAYE